MRDSQHDQLALALGTCLLAIKTNHLAPGKATEALSLVLGALSDPEWLRV